MLSKMPALLRPTGALVMVTPGHSEPAVLSVPTIPLIVGANSVVGSKSGTLAEHREMLEFAAKHKVFPVIETIKLEDLKQHLPRMQAGTVKFRLVVDTRASKFV
eukprot:Gregarina_sp_Pseudo_9__3043@NODE_3244_length_705_cov_132_300300_g2821_i1_p2_GENE_NODE_3244_length_705_cov_132_300300_g2821_i1NODE_3244_length_705_cov_132_300300_g2821_i1_p2_ORF_typecomplete_len104_score7_22_NODE_3244_length_705_cov_132_300300_g2821_i1236547